MHGALQAGALTTTFTASQGLLLMIPNMYKIAGELTPFCMHVSARTLATHALSIFGDHSDVMACRQTGFAMLCADSVQQAQDFACIAHATTLVSRVPFMHFFDGFRTSHEIARIEPLSDDVLREMIDPAALAAHRARGLSPDHPVIRGTAQNPDAFFQAREANNPYYDRCADLVQSQMDRLASLTGRQWRLVEYHGHPDAERVVVIMGSGADACHTWVDVAVARRERIGVVKVRLYRPFSADALLNALPATARRIAVLDRCKEPGALGEPLFLDVVATLAESGRPMPLIIGGRYGLGGKEFNPGMVAAVYAELDQARPKRRFTVGIHDDVTGLSLPWDASLDIEPDTTKRALFYGLGADGTVGANKSSIKIIAEETDCFAQAFFVYDSKKSGSVTVSHLRFGPTPLRYPHLIQNAQFIACHQPNFLQRFDMLAQAAPNAVFLLNSHTPSERVWDSLPRLYQERILERGVRLFVIDAAKVARDTGMGGHINTIMQTCYFGISGVLPRDAAIAAIKRAIEKNYAKKGASVVAQNHAAVDHTLEHLHRVVVPGFISSNLPMPRVVPERAPDFVQRVTALLIAGQGDTLPVSAFPVDGTWPTGTTQWEKRNIAQEIPAWDPIICIQCNKCAEICPHAAIRVKLYPPSAPAGAPPTFQSMEGNSDWRGQRYTVQVAPEDCTGCSLCVQVCPAKDKGAPRHKAIDMVPQAPLLEAERENYSFSLIYQRPIVPRFGRTSRGCSSFSPCSSTAARAPAAARPRTSRC